MLQVRTQLDLLDKEKQFYYSKLRDVELLCQTPTVNEIPVGGAPCRVEVLWEDIACQ